VVRDTNSPPENVVRDSNSPPQDVATGTWLEAAWVTFWLLNLVAMVISPRWQPIPFSLIWVSFALLYGYRGWEPRPALWLLTAIACSTGAVIGLDVDRGRGPAVSLGEIPLLVAMFLVLVWGCERARGGAENARLLTTQRRFLQDASHQLRTPITIALGHAELLARDLEGRAEHRDIRVVVGELTRLKSLSERLLVIAAAQEPDFLAPEPVALDRLVAAAADRWRSAAQRRWQFGPLAQVTVVADRDRLGMALDALLENAIQHTAAGDVIKLSVLHADHAGLARMIIDDSGAGIPRAELGHVFDRFHTGAGHPRGTGLGLALVRAIAQAHGGEVRVRSVPDAGSRFEILLPASTPAAELPAGRIAPAGQAAAAQPGQPIRVTGAGTARSAGRQPG
jgi:signal transduction histidine kinase